MNRTVICSSAGFSGLPVGPRGAPNRVRVPPAHPGNPSDELSQAAQRSAGPFHHVQVRHPAAPRGQPLSEGPGDDPRLQSAPGVSSIFWKAIWMPGRQAQLESRGAAVAVRTFSKLGAGRREQDEHPLRTSKKKQGPGNRNSQGLRQPDDRFQSAADFTGSPGRGNAGTGSQPWFCNRINNSPASYGFI